MHGQQNVKIILSLLILTSSVVFLSHGIQVFGFFFSSLLLSCSSEERNGIICTYGKIYRTIILPVLLYGCETWSLTLREERKLRVFENMVLRRIFGPRRDEVPGD